MTPAELSALAAEIRDDPLGLGYAALLPDSPGRVVDLINAPTQAMLKSRYVTARTILAECDDGAAILDKLQTIAQNVSAVKWMMVFLQQDSGMDAGHPRTVANLDQLVTSGLLSAAYAGQIKAMVRQPASRAEVLGLPAPDTYDIIAARDAQ
jgi:hypothetical protein